MRHPSLATARQRLLALTLRTPLHPTVSRRFLLLRAVGDASLERPVALRYAPHDGGLIVVAQPEAAWWRPLSPDAPTRCTVRFKGHQTAMAATLAAGDALDELILRYLQKYPGEWKALGVDARASADDVETAARGKAVVSFTPA